MAQGGGGLGCMLEVLVIVGAGLGGANVGIKLARNYVIVDQGKLCFLERTARAGQGC